MTDLTISAWQGIIQKLTDAEKDVLLQVIDEQLAVLARRAQEHREQRKQLANAQYTRMQEDTKALQSIREKLKHL